MLPVPPEPRKVQERQRYVQYWFAASSPTIEIQSFITILSDIVSNVEAEKLLDAENELCASICAEGLFEPNDRMKLYAGHLRMPISRLNILYNSAADYSNEKILILKHMITSCDGMASNLSSSYRLRRGSLQVHHEYQH